MPYREAGIVKRLSSWQLRTARIHYRNHAGHSASNGNESVGRWFSMRKTSSGIRNSLECCSTRDAVLPIRLSRIKDHLCGRREPALPKRRHLSAKVSNPIRTLAGVRGSFFAFCRFLVLAKKPQTRMDRSTGRIFSRMPATVKILSQGSMPGRQDFSILRIPDFLQDFVSDGSFFASLKKRGQDKAAAVLPVP